MILDLNNDHEVSFNELDLNSDNKIDEEETKDISRIKVALNLKDKEPYMLSLEYEKQDVTMPQAQAWAYKKPDARR